MFEKNCTSFEIFGSQIFTFLNFLKHPLDYRSVNTFLNILQLTDIYDILSSTNKCTTPLQNPKINDTRKNKKQKGPYPPNSYN